MLDLSNNQRVLAAVEMRVRFFRERPGRGDPALAGKPLNGLEPLTY